MTQPLFKNLGIGVSLRPKHYSHFADGPPSSVSWVEVISENFMAWTRRPSGRSLQRLQKIRRDVPVVLHGVSLSIGAAEPLSRPYLAKLKELASCIEPAWISDHLCWTGIDGTQLHDLLPLPYTEETLSLVAAKVRQVQDTLGRRILLENPSSYLEFAHSEITEWDFLAELARRADCGLLLDINNIYVSSINHGFDPLTYLNAIPPKRVGQIHLAGHSVEEGGYLFDTHGTPVCEAVWDLYRQACRTLSHVSAMIERDANIPAWSELEPELARAAQIRKEAALAKPTHAHRAAEAFCPSPAHPEL